MKRGKVIPYLKKIKGIDESCDNFLEISIFFTRNLLLHHELQLQIIFHYIVSNTFKFFWVFKESFNKDSFSFGDVGKIGSASLLDIKVFPRKRYDAVIFTHDVNNKNLSHDSELYCGCGHEKKNFKTKIQKELRANSYVSRRNRGKTGSEGRGELFGPLP